MESEWADENPNMHYEPGAPVWQATHYKVTFSRPGVDDFETYFSMGLAHTSEPEANMVLDALRCDAEAANYHSFEEWASDLGYDTDSRRAERTFEACSKTATDLNQFLGDDLFRELLEELERL
jgi:hypothetical protein